jgi:copper chaperone NosL
MRGRLHAAARTLQWLAVAAAVAACRPTPRPLEANRDACAYCRMTISDLRFGAEVITRTGKLHTFDSIDCLASFVHGLKPEDVAQVVVTDFRHPGAFITASQAVFVMDGAVASPMGRRLAAFAAGIDTTALRAEFGGRVLSWANVLALPPSAGHAGAANAATANADANFGASATP